MVKVELQNVRYPDWYIKERKISKHSRKLNGETFVAPRIILPPDYNDMIGKYYLLFDADVKLEIEEYWGKRRIKGKAILLVVPEKEEKIEDFEEEDWDEEE